jgi:tetraacyldisaccharide 4'-kinase
LSRPVISIGALAAGGSGKTPLTAHVAETLVAMGERPAVLSRGYGRAEPVDGVVVVRDTERVVGALATAGDEPWMLAQALDGVAVVVAADRYLAGRLAETHLGVTVHLLDDGFQHFQLERGTDLLVVSPADLDDPVLLPADCGSGWRPRDTPMPCSWSTSPTTNEAWSRSVWGCLGASGYVATWA